MSKEKIELKTKGGYFLLHAVVASVQDNFDGFRKHMIETGVIIREIGVPMAYYAEYSETGRGELAAMYFGRPVVGIRHDTGILALRTGPLLIVSGLEERIVNQETEALMAKMGESEDPESVQLYITALQHYPAVTVLK